MYPMLSSIVLRTVEVYHAHTCVETVMYFMVGISEERQVRPGMNVWNPSPYPDCSLSKTIFCNILYKGFVKYVIYKVIFVKLSD